MAVAKAIIWPWLSVFVPLLELQPRMRPDLSACLTLSFSLSLFLCLQVRTAAERTPLRIDTPGRVNRLPGYDAHTSAAPERRGNILEGFKGFYLNAKARIWP